MNYIQYLRQYVGTKPIIAVGAAIVIRNKKGEILLQLRSDTHDWGLPGGSMEMGDSFLQTAAKELYEETGLHAENFQLLTIASGKEMYYQYPHGDEVYNVTAVYEAQGVSGDMQVDEEGLALQYFPLTQLPKLNYTSNMLLQQAGILQAPINEKEATNV